MRARHKQAGAREPGLVEHTRRLSAKPEDDLPAGRLPRGGDSGARVRKGGENC